jgi:hypothetical protein
MQVKGTAVETLPIFIKMKFGEQALERWLKALGALAQKEYSGLIMASGWYPLREMFIEPTQALCDVFFERKISGAEEVGRFSAEHALKGIYKFFIKLGSPESLIERAGMIFPTYYRPSAMNIVDKVKGGATFRITQFEDAHPTVEHRILGWIERALQISGAKSPQVQIVCSMTSGAACTDINCRWE